MFLVEEVVDEAESSRIVLEKFLYVIIAPKHSPLSHLVHVDRTDPRCLSMSLNF
jgi:hypothetical protein